MCARTECRYNAVCLGLAMWAVCMALEDRLALSAALVVLAVAFKQIALYFVPAFGAFILARCLRKPRPCVALWCPCFRNVLCLC